MITWYPEYAEIIQRRIKTNTYHILLHVSILSQINKHCEATCIPNSQIFKWRHSDGTSSHANYQTIASLRSKFNDYILSTVRLQDHVIWKAMSTSIIQKRLTCQRFARVAKRVCPRQSRVLVTNRRGFPVTSLKVEGRDFLSLLSDRLCVALIPELRCQSLGSQICQQRQNLENIRRRYFPRRRVRERFAD